MISFLHGSPPPAIFDVGSSIHSYRPQGVWVQEEDDPALTAWLWAGLQRQHWLSYAHDIQRQIDKLRERLADLEREQERVFSSHGQLEDNITLPLNIVRTFPARIVERIESSFYLYGPESEE